MRAQFKKRNGRRGTTLILMLMMLPVLIIPLVGLAIDGTMLYIVQSKLSAAVDGAALGAGRLLGTPADPKEIAGEFLLGNFPCCAPNHPKGPWGAKNMQQQITVTQAIATTTIQIQAQVDVPLLFMRVIGWPQATVGAAATATRSDTRVVLVLDRSASMSGAPFTAMISAAKLFTGMFTPGNDELGLVVFGGTAIVGYPVETQPYSTDPHSSGGPDGTFATSSIAGPMFTQIGKVQAGSYTATTEALSLAYIELQKAHFRDLAANGVDKRLNAIVLFTDGVPTALAVSPNDSTNNAMKPKQPPVDANHTPCTYAPDDGVAGHKMRGYIAAIPPQPAAYTWGAPSGMYLLAPYDSANSVNAWLGTSNVGTKTPGDQPNPLTAVAGCTGLNRTTSNVTLTDMIKMPPTDFYGNSTSGTGYTHSTAQGVYNGTAYDPTKIILNSSTGGYHFGLGVWNATDNVGVTIRNGSAMGAIAAPGMNPVAIYAIGYQGNGGTDAGLLKRLANTLDSSSYSSTQQSGLYVEAANPSELAGAFTLVASELLRLAQ
jgi:hypothetical protein